MDKRWIIILIITILGLGAMYYITITSTTVGSAVTIVGDLSVTTPQGFKIAENNGDNAKLIDEKTNETIEIFDLDKGNAVNKNKKEILDLLDNDTDNEIINTGGNATVKTVTYKDTKHDEIQTVYITCVENRTIDLIMSHFSDQQKEKETLNFIIDTIKPDYKQKRA